MTTEPKGELQRTMAWKNVDRKRAAHLAWARRTFNVALMRQFLQFDRHWSDVTNTTDMTQYFDLSPTPIAEAFNAVYVRVGEAFAKETFNGLKSHYGYQIKDIEFSPFDEALRAWVATYAGERIVGITSTTQVMIQKLLQRAIDEGMGVAKAQALIRSEFTTMSRLRAERIARTEIVSASNLGSIEAARSTGLTLQKNWLSTRDARTREAHAEVDGQVAELEGYFIVGGEELAYPGDINGSADNVINCFTGDNRVFSNGIKKIIRTRFTGKTYTVHLSDESSFTATGNHPILSRGGFIRVDQIQHGMEIVAGFGDVDCLIDFDVDNVPPTFEQTFNALAVSKHRMRVSGVKMNLYGRVIDTENGDVDVIDVELLLGYAIPSHAIQSIEDVNFKHTNLAEGSFLSDSLINGTFDKELPILVLDGNMGAFDLRHSLLMGHGRPFNSLGFGLIPTGDSLLDEPHVNSGSGNSQLFGNGVFTHAGLIEQGDKSVIDDDSLLSGSYVSVVHIEEKFVKDEYVYTLETIEGIYNVNSIIASNCRCTVTYTEI
jgi:hypothetical protein